VLSRYSRGERFVVVAGGILLLSLLFFPWHRDQFGGTATALREPNSQQGTIAFLVAVAMVLQILMAKWTGRRANPSLVRLQPAAALAVLGLLLWKLAALPEILSVGCYIGLAAAGTLVYGAFIYAKEFAAGL
jgi:hypothetical protein